MELYNKKDNPNLSPETNSPPQNLPTDETIKPESTDVDMRDEGVDIVGSGVREENEFTGLESPDADVPFSSSTPIPTEPMSPKQEVTPPPQPKPIPEPQPPVTPKESPLSPIPAPTPIPTPAPPKTVTPQTPASAPISAIPDKKEPPKAGISNDPSIKPIRTFKTDAEEAVRYQNVSTVDIAVAEQKKKEKEGVPIEYVEPSSSHTGLWITVVIVVLVLISGGAYFFLKNQKTTVTPIQASVETIIPYSKGSTVVLNEETNPLELISVKLASSDAALGNVYVAIPTLKATSTEAAPLETVFSDTNMPSRLMRSLAPDYMIGSYMFEVNAPFVILKNTFFQNAFAGMLEWEVDLRNDLLPLIQVSYPGESTITTATDVFEDIVISNIDTRVLLDEEGKVILVYAFADTETLVITTSEETLKFLLDQLLTVRSIQ